MNEKVNLVSEEILSDNWYTLRKFTFDYQLADGSWERQSREAYDRGNGATILLYNKEKQTVFLPDNSACQLIPMETQPEC